MIRFVKRLWKAAPVAIVILALALAAGGFVAVRTAAFWIYWSDPAHREQAIEGWMTPGYIAHSWQVPREVVLEALDAPVPGPNGPMTLQELAASNGVTVEELIAAAEAAIAEFQVRAPRDD